MSREIKFRAWDNQEKKMYYDVQDISDMNEISGFGSFERILNVPMEDEYGEIDGTRRFEVMQYTDLKDKNDKEIYEGDIVKTSKFGVDDGNGHNFSGFDLFTVKWDNGGFALFNRWRRFNLRDDRKNYEVAGNIFDNPELL